MIRRLAPAISLIALSMAACRAPVEHSQPAEPPVEGAPPAPIEATSLLGEELARPTLPEAFRQQQEALLAEARQTLEAAPQDIEALIWVGRRTAYLGRYQEAIDIYSDGIERHPGNAALYRHRGHRYISTRQLDAAIADLAHAAELVEGQPDEIEADGLPNERGIPTSTLQSNIYYHLGLAHYLRADFDSAVDAYQRCLEVSSTEDNVVATAHWLYMALRRQGRDAEAEDLLAPITAEMDIIENHDYHRLLLMYKGVIDAEELWDEVFSVGDTLGSATLGYGVGNWLYYQGIDGKGGINGKGGIDDGERDDAFDVFARIQSGEQWAAFGYVAAEAELARLPADERDIYSWRSGRLGRLFTPDGWLSVVGLYWLEEGDFTFGTDATADFVFPEEGGPEASGPRLFGTLSVEGSGDAERFYAEPAPGVEILTDSGPIEGKLELSSDSTGTPTYLEVEPYRFYLIERSDRPFLRVVDLSRAARVEKPRIPHFPIDLSWRIEARFEPYDPPRTIPVPTILETTNQSTSPGALVFERDGSEYRLDAIESGNQLFIIFGDHTTGEETYGGGRYMYTELADEDGLITVDFNRAYNPPCVFTVHATCPLPPRQNKLDLRVEAGEKMIHGYLEH